MSVDKAFREMIREEVTAQLRPLRNELARMMDGSELFSLRDLADRLTPLTALLGGRPGRRAIAARGPGRKGRGRRVRAASGANDRPCALIGCKSKARSKGYCAAHYQKFRNLAKTNRLPADWKEHAEPNTVKDIVLPRGRAAAKALRAARQKG